MKTTDDPASAGFTVYAAAHIDGRMILESMRFGVLKIQPTSPVANFMIEAGSQRHPIWALNRLAIVVYAFSQVAQNAGETEIEVNLKGSLISGPQLSNIIAASMSWHTSQRIRAGAEKLIAEMTGSGSRHKERPWPSTVLEIPVTKKQ
jgi:hypothetical protein